MGCTQSCPETNASKNIEISVQNGSFCERIPGVRSQFEEVFGQAARCFSCVAWMLGRAVHVNVERDRAALPTAGELRRLLRVAAADKITRGILATASRL